MASPDTSANGDAQPTVEQITFRFCRNCSNLLYPEENKHERKLVYKCRTCIYSEDATSMCVHRRQLLQTVGETAGVTQDVGKDPTVGDNDVVSLSMIESSSDSSYESDAESADLCMCTLCGQELVCDDCGEGAVSIQAIDQQRHHRQPTQKHSQPMQVVEEHNKSLSATIVKIRELRVLHLDEDYDDFNSNLPRSNRVCPACGEQDNVFFQSQQRTEDTGMKLFYVCCNCGRIFDQESSDPA